MDPYHQLFLGHQHYQQAMAKPKKSKSKSRKKHTHTKYHTQYNTTQLRRLTTLALNKQIAKVRLYTTQKELKQLPFVTLQSDPVPPPLPQSDPVPPPPPSAPPQQDASLPQDAGLQLGTGPQLPLDQLDLGQASEEWLQQCFSADYTDLIKPFYVYLYSLQITTRSRQKHSSRINSFMSLLLLSVTNM